MTASHQSCLTPWLKRLTAYTFLSFQTCDLVQAKAASDARLARDIQQAEDRAEATAAEEARLRQQELDSIDR